MLWMLAELVVILAYPKNYNPSNSHNPQNATPLSFCFASPVPLQKGNLRCELQKKADSFQYYAPKVPRTQIIGF